MKIGEFSRKFNVPIATVRHYINTGLIIPEKDSFQYNFTDINCREMEIILEMKSAGCKLHELNKYLNIFRFYNKDDYLLYEKLAEFLRMKKQSLYDERTQINTYIRLINKKIKDIEHNSSSINKKASDNEDMITSTASKNKLPGFPLDVVDMLYCPQCQSKIDLSNVDISGSSIINGKITCRCGYHATIKDGVLYTEDIVDLENDPKFLEWYFGEENLITNEDGVILMAMNDCTNQFLINMYKGGQWIHKELNAFDLRGKVLLFPDLSAQYLYNYYNSENVEGSTFLITALSERTIHTMRQHIANANPNLKIAYIINQNGQLPLKRKCIDAVIDYIGSSNLGFYNKDHYINMIAPYIAEDAVIAGSIEYYKKGCRSLARIRKDYSNSANKVMTSEFTKEALTKNMFEIRKFESIGTPYEPGPFFEYHVAGDMRYNTAYLATRSRK